MARNLIVSIVAFLTMFIFSCGDEQSVSPSVLNEMTEDEEQIISLDPEAALARSLEDLVVPDLDMIFFGVDDDDITLLTGSIDTCGNNAVDLPTLPTCTSTTTTNVYTLAEYNAWQANPVTPVRIRASIAFNGQSINVSTGCTFLTEDNIQLTGLTDVIISARQIELKAGIEATGQVSFNCTESILVQQNGDISGPAVSVVMEAPTLDLSGDVAFTERYCADGNAVIIRLGSYNGTNEGSFSLAGISPNILGQFTNLSTVSIVARQDLLVQSATGISASDNVTVQAQYDIDYRGDIQTEKGISLYAGNDIITVDDAYFDAVTNIIIHADGTLDYDSDIHSAQGLSLYSGDDMILRSDSLLTASGGISLSCQDYLDVSSDFYAGGAIAISTNGMIFRPVASMQAGTQIHLALTGTTKLDYYGVITDTPGGVFIAAPQILLRSGAQIINSGPVQITVTGLFEDYAFILNNGPVCIDSGSYKLASSHRFTNNASCVIGDVMASGSVVPNVCTEGTATCAATCSPDLIYENGTCIDVKEVACVPTGPKPEHSHYSNAQVIIAYTTANGWSAPANCTWECDTDYISEDDQNCINEKQVSCDPENNNPENSHDIVSSVTVHYTTANNWEAPVDCAWSCDEGYHENNGLCESDTPDLCDGITCSGHGTCTVTDHKLTRFGGTSFDFLTGILRSGNGQLHLAGYTNGSLSGPGNGYMQAFIMRTDEAHSVLGTFETNNAYHTSTTTAAYAAENTLIFAIREDDPAYSYPRYSIKRTDISGTQISILPIGDNNITALGTDSTGSLLITGQTNKTQWPTPMGMMDGYIFKGVFPGILTWARQFGTSQDDTPTALAVNSADDIFVVGTSNNPTPVRRDIFIQKYAADGTAGWLRILGSTFNEGVFSVITDDAGGLYLTGLTAGGLDGTNNGLNDILLAKLSQNDGSTIWLHQYGTAANESGRVVLSVLTGPDGYLYVIGTTYGDLEGVTNEGLMPNGMKTADVFVSRFDSAGLHLATRLFGSVTDNWIPTGAVMSSEGTLHIAGNVQELNQNYQPADQDVFLLSVNFDGLNAFPACTCDEGYLSEGTACVVCSEGMTETRACGLNGRGHETKNCVDHQWGEWSPCVDNDVCLDNATEEQVCGLNGRGNRTMICNYGQWQQLSACNDPDICVDGTTDNRACGLNGRGMENRACFMGQWTAWNTCIDPDVCGDGATDFRACGLNGRGTETRNCATGQWLAWSACADTDICQDGTIGTQPCGLNDRGVGSRTCVTGQWSSWTCTDPDICQDNLTETRSCGLNGRGIESRLCMTGQWTAWSCNDGDDCVDDTIRTQACGLNGRSQETSTCVLGHWSAWSACGDTDICLDGATDQRSCGLNGRGTELRACIMGQWSEWDICNDPDVCADGAADSRACGVNSRGAEARTCEIGQWTAWSACADTDVCLDGTTETHSCGLNERGTETRNCVTGQWSSWSCSDPDACQDGMTETHPCGLNGRGTETRACVTGQWSNWTCIDSDECSDDTIRTRSCGLNGRSEETSTCVLGHWSAWSACGDTDVCLDGAADFHACGLNDRGIENRSCLMGQWTEWSICADPDVCGDGAADSRACGLNGRGTQARTCEIGQWSAWSVCIDADICQDGSYESHSCGLNGRGTESRTCTSGQWTSWTCTDPDICEDGLTGTRPCGLNGRGTETRICVIGQWSAWECTDPDICGDGATETHSCGLNDRGTESRTCAAGQWTSWSCTDPDVCTDGQTENLPCGLNGRGEKTRTCTTGAWSTWTCVDPDECLDNATRTCSSICEAGTETCTGGSWQPCTARQPESEICDGIDNDCNGQTDEIPECIDPCEMVDCSGHGTCHLDNESNPYCTCETGYTNDGNLHQCINIKMVPCNDIAPANATSQIVDHQVFYTPETLWSLPPYCAWSCNSNAVPYEGACVVSCEGIACSEHGECLYDTEDVPYCQCDNGYHASNGLDCVVNECENLEEQFTRACGYNGRGMESVACINYEIVVITPCEDPDNCVDNTSQEWACGLNGRGWGSDWCWEGQWWVGPCGDPDVCTDGETSSQVCGFNGRGIEELWCFMGQWSPNGCSDPDICYDGSVEGTPCGVNGRGIDERTCIDGQWGESGGCVDPDECSDSSAEEKPNTCGLNTRGTQTRICNSGQWTSWTCTDPDECVDDTTRTQSCGLNGRSEQISTCVLGHWSAWSACGDTDICLDGAADQRACGLNGRGSESRFCVLGQWNEWENCIDPDQCVDVDSEQRVCGLNDRGTETRVCVTGQWGVWSCSDPDICTDGATHTQACGLNGRGTSSRTCENGQWGALSACVDPDICLDGSTENMTCGINGRSTITRTCEIGQWTAWSTCTDPDVCNDGTADSRACGINGRGTQDRICEIGQWSAWSVCVDIDVCQDGSYESHPCGINDRGAETRTCENGQWTSWTCDDPDACQDGFSEARSCGLNGRGTETRTCATGQWGTWECVDSDECIDDTTRTQACGINGRSTELSTCVLGQWSAWSACGDTDICLDGATEQRACGLNGRSIESHTCLMGQWTAWEGCADTDECIDDTTETHPCGLNAAGTETRTCVSGFWSEWICVDDDVCVNGNTEQRVCGINGRGTEDRSCVNGQWTAWTVCADTDICLDGSTEEQNCGINGRSTITRTCETGQWTAWSACADTDVCLDGAAESHSCGINNRGGESRVCETGQWTAWTCTDPDVCLDNDSQTGAVCGLNGRGYEQRDCLLGQWSAWVCLDPDSCVDDSYEEFVCGLNGRGTGINWCWGGQWWEGPCGDPDVCMDGSSMTQPCGYNGRGYEDLICSVGQWITNGCVDPDICSDYSSEALACGINNRGMVERYCTDGQWGEWGECSDPDVCADNESESHSCGINGRGTESHTCENGQWTAWSCTDPDECLDDATRTQPCGINGRSEQIAVCAAGHWSDWSACGDTDICLDGATDQRFCGLNGRGEELRTCVMGQWTEWDICNDPDECADTDSEFRACGLNDRGTETRVCATGHWGAWGVCIDPDVCTDNDTRTQTCGLNGRGTETALCELGLWGVWGDCVDSDECVDGATETGTCGLNEGSMISRTCTTGHWTEWSVCDDTDICVNGTERPAPLGCSDGTQTCVNGQWAADEICNGTGSCAPRGSFIFEDGDPAVSDTARQTFALSNGEYLLVGTTDGIFPGYTGTTDTGKDIYFARLDNLGNIVSTWQSAQDDRSLVDAYYSNGFVYLIEKIQTTAQYYLSKRTVDGTEALRFDITETNPTIQMNPRTILADAAGNTYVAGYFNYQSSPSYRATYIYTRKYSPTGSSLGGETANQVNVSNIYWPEPITDSVFGADGNIYVFGKGRFAFIYRYNAASYSYMQLVELGRYDTIDALIAMDTHLYIAGRNNGLYTYDANTKLFVMSYEIGYGYHWTSTFDGTGTESALGLNLTEDLKLEAVGQSNSPVLFTSGGSALQNPTCDINGANCRSTAFLMTTDLRGSQQNLSILDTTEQTLTMTGARIDSRNLLLWGDLIDPEAPVYTQAFLRTYDRMTASAGDYCVCNTDYHPQGEECVTNESCGGQTCSSKGTCSVLNGLAYCSCNANYTNEGNRTQCINQKQTPCTPNAVLPEHAIEGTQQVMVSYNDASGWTTAATCVWTCETNYYKTSSACINQQQVMCDTNNGNPSNSADIVTSVTVNYTTAGGWSHPADCAWQCVANYARENDVCIHEKQADCHDAAPLNATSTIIPVTVYYSSYYDDYTHSYYGEWSVAADCPFTCHEGYTLENGQCINQKQVACYQRYAPPPHSTTISNPTVTVTYTTAGGWSSPEDCRWNCQTNYTYENYYCINQKQVPCIPDPNKPSYSHDLTADVTITYTTSGGWSTAEYCLWACDEGYVNISGECLLKAEVNCIDDPAKPVGAVSHYDEVSIGYDPETHWSQPAYCPWECAENYKEYGNTRFHLDDGLLVHYTFDDPANKGKDSSGNGYNGTENGAPNMIPIQTGTGINGTSAISMTAYQSKNILLPDDPALKRAVFTVSMYIKPSSSGNWVIFSDYSGPSGFILYANQYGVVLNLKASRDYVIATYDILPLNRWSHIVATFDGEIAKIFVNGRLSASEARNDRTVYVGTQPYYIGSAPAWSSDAQYSGAIDDFRLYDHAISECQVRALFEKSDVTATCTVEGQTRSCGSSVGTCTTGTQTCSGGFFTECVGNVAPVDESCDGLDNDCDGVVDNNCWSYNEREVDCDANVPANAAFINERVLIKYENGAWSEPSVCPWQCIDGFIEEAGQCVPVRDYDLSLELVDAQNVSTDNSSLALTGSALLHIRNNSVFPMTRPYTVIVFEDSDYNGTYNTGDRIFGTLLVDQWQNPDETITVDVPLNGEAVFVDDVLYAFVDSGNVIEESNENNNIANNMTTCEYYPPVGQFDPQLEWEWRTTVNEPLFTKLNAAPVVVNLTDDNGDGLINADDDPDIILNNYNGEEGVLRALRGNGSGEIFTIFNPKTYRGSNPAAGDIDGDGKPEIVVVSDPTTGYKLMAFEHDGTFKWMSSQTSGLFPVIADLDHDGIPEIVTGAGVFNNDGTLRFGITNAELWSFPCVADFNLDGMPEVVASRQMVDRFGTIIWSKSTEWLVGRSCAVANFDDDPYPEIVLTGNQRVSMYEHDGTIKWGPLEFSPSGTGNEWQWHYFSGGAALIADLDNDGDPEIGVASGLRYDVYEKNGILKWRVETQDISSHATGSTAFDFDGDGSTEIVYNDENYLRIYRGTDGVVLFAERIGSSTLCEYPVVADVDNDNNAELLVVGDGYGTGGKIGLFVFGDKNDTWVNTRKIWNDSSYHITNVEEDGAIPAYEANSWEGFNNYRQNQAVDAHGCNDLTASYLRVANDDLPASLDIIARVGNGGALHIARGVPVSFYLGDPANGGTYLGTVETTTRIYPGRYEDVSFTWQNPPAGEHIFYAVADRDAENHGKVSEINENNNTGHTVFRQCTTGETRICGSDLGICIKGIQTCDGGKWGDCLGDIEPQIEFCDRIDNDCNGQVDNDCRCIDDICECNGDEYHLIPCEGDETLAQKQTCIHHLWENDGDCMDSDLADTLMAQYCFDNASNIAADCSGNGYNGYQQGGVGYAKGVIGSGSALFDGGDDRMRFPTSLNSLFGTDDFSLSFFVNLPSDTANMNLLAKDYTDDWGRQFFINASRADSIFMFYDGHDGEYVAATSVAAVGKTGALRWTHLAFVREGMTLAMYVDGVMVDYRVLTKQIDVSNGAPLGIGTSVLIEKGWGVSPFRGRIDDLRIYGRAINELEAKNIFDQYQPVCQDGDTDSCTTACGEGFKTCIAEEWGACVVAGAAPDFGATCHAGFGSCLRIGTVQCDGLCSAIPGIPRAEVCNGVDDDCNDLVDDNCVQDNEPPYAALLLDAEVDVKNKTTIAATVSDAHLEGWRLEMAIFGTENYRTLAEGAEELTESTIYTLDPTILPNGMYSLRLSAWDTAGHEFTTAPHTIVVSGKLKIGPYSFAMTDITIPVSGIPLTVTRTYNSTDKEKGDFGIGWDLLIGSGVKVQRTTVPGTDWYSDYNEQCTYMGEGVYLPCYELKRIGKKPRYFVTWPDGKQEQFELDAYFRDKLNPGLVNYRFIPLNDTTSTMTAVASAELDMKTDILYDYTSETPDVAFDPVEFILTTIDGTRYHLSRTKGIKTITDRNGNRIEITPTAIIHQTCASNGLCNPTGREIGFERDTENRIVRVVNDSGATSVETTYQYDAAGDLRYFTDLSGQEWEYRYDAEHNLNAIIDPRGINVLNLSYDAQGRLIGTSDALGYDTSVVHDTANVRELVTDPMGHTRIYEYDTDGNVVTEYFRPHNGTEELVKSMTYDAKGNQLTETDALGHTTVWTFDSLNRKTSELLPGMTEPTRWEYDDNSDRVSREIDPAGKVTRSCYDGRGNLVRTVYPGADGTTATCTDNNGVYSGQTYDASGNLTAMRDADGNTTSFSYDAYGNQLTMTDAEGHVVHYEYDARGNKSRQYETVTYGEGQSAILTTLYEYDDAGRLVKSTQPDGRYTQTIYNAIGKAWKTRDLDGRWTEYFYSDRGEQVGVLYWDNTTEATTYTETGKQDTHTDREGIVTKYEYDAKGRQSKVYRFYGTADEAMTETRYDSTGRVVEEFDALRNRTAYQYDAQGRRTITTDALGNYSKSTYDTKGNLATTETCSAANVCTGKVRYAYDNQSRRVATIHVKPDLTELVLEQSGYTRGGRLHTKTDANGNVTEFGYTPTGRLAYVVQTLVTETGPETLLTEYTYDSRGNKLTQTDALERTTLWEYDQYGRLKKHTLPLGQYETYTYNADGTLATKTDFNGDTTVYTYDPQYKRLTTVAYADTTTESYTYDPVSGRRLTATDDDGTTTYQYYPVTKRLWREYRTVDRPKTYTYDLNGNTLTETTSDGVKTFVRDPLNRLQSLTDEDGNTITYVYRHDGRPLTATDEDGTVNTYFYDSLGRVIVEEKKNGANVVIQQIGYELDNLGNRTRIVFSNGNELEYTYDSLNRMTSETKNGVADIYLLDSVGNRLQKTTGENIVSYLYDDNDRLISEIAEDATGPLSTKNYTFDANGNMITDGLRTYSYDKRNKFIGITDGVNVTSYSYDADGNRTAKIVNGVKTNYLVSNAYSYPQVIAEYDDNGTTTATYAYGNDLVSMKRGGTRYFYNHDVHGTTRSLSVNGQITDTYDYDAYGNLTDQTGSTENNYRYAGEQYDPETGNYYLRARYYDPSVGRFTRMDDWQGSQENPITLNKYAYANGNPVMGVDPSGRMTIVELGRNLLILSTLAAVAIPSSARNEGHYDIYNMPLGMKDIYYMFFDSILIDNVIIKAHYSDSSTRPPDKCAEFKAPFYININKEDITPPMDRLTVIPTIGHEYVHFLQMGGSDPYYFFKKSMHGIEKLIGIFDDVYEWWWAYEGEARSVEKTIDRWLNMSIPMPQGSWPGLAPVGGRIPIHEWFCRDNRCEFTNDLIVLGI